MKAAGPAVGRVMRLLMSAVLIGAILTGAWIGRLARQAGALPVGSVEVAGLISPNLPSVIVDGAATNYVTWITPSSELPGTLYEVVRTAGPGAGSIICNEESVSAGSASTCPDYSVRPQTRYGYTVRALLGDYWHSDATVYARTAALTYELDLDQSAPAAGQPFAVTGIRVSKPGQYSVDTAYSGWKTLRWSGLAVSAGGQAPEYPTGAVTRVLFRNGEAGGLRLTFTSYSEGPNLLLAADEDGQAGGTGTVTVGWGPAVGLAFGLQPTGGVASGQPLSASPQIYVIDAFGNVSGSAEPPVRLGIAGGPPGGSLTCPGAPGGAAKATFGVASYSGCRISGPPGSYVISAVSTGLTGTGGSDEIAILPPPE